MMSERQSSDFDFDEHRGATPVPGADSAGGAISESLPGHPRPEEAPAPNPVFDPAKWPTSPPAHAAEGAEPAGSPSGGLPVPPQRGTHRSPTDAETTSIVDRQWLAAQIEQHRTTAAADADQGADPYEVTTDFRLAGPPPVGAAPRPVPDPRAGEIGRPGPGWQPPPPQPGQWGPPPQQPHPPHSAPAPAPAPGYGAGEWTGAQGSAASWNYVDNIRSSELVPSRRIPPGRGWRKVLYYSTFKLINPGQSPDERYEDELEAKVRSLLRGTYKIGVLGKGGVGKSTVSAGVGSIFAELRQDDRVVAVDADTAFGKLGARIDPNASGSYWELANDRNLNTFADMRSRVGSNAAGLFVLPGEAQTQRRRVLDPAVYRAATHQLNRHFTLSIIDCGSTMDSAVTQEVLGDVDALIVVSSPWFDGASAAGQTLEWLANSGYTALLHRTVVVVNDSDGHAGKKDLKLLVERFGKHGQKVIQLPYDAHLRPGGVIDIRNDVDPLTRRRFLELAAECAEHFGATSDRPSQAGLVAPPRAHGPVDRPRGV
jgi:MinD-like ATPase involved in chromosome partitioning or flagellar assembly